jgi:LysR family hydrogen peroxide-inducible transcriptional activator
VQLPVRSADVEVRRLFREQMKLAIAQDHPLAGKAEASDGDLAGPDILTMSNRYLLHEPTVALYEELGANLRQEDESTSLDALSQMTALDMGLSFLPAHSVCSKVSREAGDVAVLTSQSDRFTRSVGLVWRCRSAHGNVIERIAEVVRSVAEERFKGLVTTE